MSLHIKAFFHQSTFTLSYLVFDEQSRDAILIDPVRDYDALSSSVSFVSAKEIGDFVEENHLALHYVLETHAHADHLSGAPYFQERFASRVAIGQDIREVQETFRNVFALEDDFATDGSQFDTLLRDDEVLVAGSLRIRALHTPGHTPACMSFLIEDAVFTGDALFMPDYGVGRCDFPKGDARALYHSVQQKLYALPDDTRVFVGHDYQPGGRALAFETSIKESKEENVQLNAQTGEEDFVTRRQDRDRTLAPPRLLFPSVQVNIDAGRLPPADEQERRFLKIPLRQQ